MKKQQSGKKLRKKWQSLNKMLRYTIIGVLCLLLILLAQKSIAYTDTVKEVRTVQKKLVTEKRQLKELSGKIEACYKDKSEEYLKTDLSKAAIDSLKQQFATVKKVAYPKQLAELGNKNQQKRADLKRKITAINHQYQLQLATNQLFLTESVLKADQVASAPVVKPEITNQQIQSLKAKYHLSDKSKKTGFEQKVLTLLEVATKQVTDNQAAEKAVAELFSDQNQQQLAGNIKRSNYNAAKTKVDALKNSPLKEKLQAKLATALAQIEQNEYLEEQERIRKEEERQRYLEDYYYRLSLEGY